MDVKEVATSRGFQYIKKACASIGHERHLLYHTKFNSYFDLYSIPKTINIDPKICNIVGRSLPNIETLHEIWEYENFTYFLTDHISGEPLSSFLIYPYVFDQTKLIRITKKLIETLFSLHEEGIPHRRLNPSVIYRDNLGIAFVSGYGIILKNDPVFSGNDIDNPYFYQPPEFYLKSEYDPYKADIWSLGITLFVLAAGKIPWNNSGQPLSQAIRAENIEFSLVTNVKLQILLRGICVNDPNKRMSLVDILKDPYLSLAPMIQKSSVIISNKKIRETCSDPHAFQMAKGRPVGMQYPQSRAFNLTAKNLLKGK